MSKFVRFEGVKKVYRMGEVEIEALRDATFAVEKGELCVIVGPSGAGKTTLLNILGGMDTLTEGRVFLGDEEVSAYTPRQLTAYRRHDIGFVFQFYNLVPNLTALENVELAALFQFIVYLLIIHVDTLSFLRIFRFKFLPFYHMW